MAPTSAPFRRRRPRWSRDWSSQLFQTHSSALLWRRRTYAKFQPPVRCNGVSFATETKPCRTNSGKRTLSRTHFGYQRVNNAGKTRRTTVALAAGVRMFSRRRSSIRFLVRFRLPPVIQRTELPWNSLLPVLRFSVTFHITSLLPVLRRRLYHRRRSRRLKEK